MKNQFDIKRLSKIITLLEKVDEICYHMDNNEYERSSRYIYDRFKINFPPQKSITNTKPLSELKK